MAAGDIVDVAVVEFEFKLFGRSCRPDRR